MDIMSVFVQTITSILGYQASEIEATNIGHFMVICSCFWRKNKNPLQFAFCFFIAGTREYVTIKNTNFELYLRGKNLGLLWC